MKTIKVSEASDLQLNWLVAKLRNSSVTNQIVFHGQVPMMVMDLSNIGYYPYPESASDSIIPDYVHDWSLVGPIIDEKKMGFEVPTFSPMNSVIAYYPDWQLRDGSGNTHIIAALRCYIINELGQDVEVPEELP